jgi:alpha-tubulin suppressor-like RCC1 family protein
MLNPGLAAVLAVACLLAACGGGEPDAQARALAQHIYLAPARVAPTLAFDRLAVGAQSSCMLTADGSAWCWGNNEFGQLGATSSLRCDGASTPCDWRPLAAVPPLRFSALGVGRLHGCGLDTAGQGWCWGFGVGGQLGDGRSADSRSAVAVAGGHRFVQIDAGRDGLLSCALDDAGSAWCWGPAGGGALGNGSTDMANQPVQVVSTVPFVSVGAGSDHACALDASGQAWCWGRNSYGKLGRGVPGAATLPQPVAGGHRFTALAVGGEFNCALDTAGAAWCWGFSESIGDGGASHRDVPTAVAGGHVFSQLSAGYQNSCALTADGSAWCWGMAELVGDGSGVRQRVPVPLAGAQRWRLVQAGGIASCGLRLDGSAWCWGFNTYGSVGQDNVAP